VTAIDALDAARTALGGGKWADARLRASIQPYRTRFGGYRLENVFRYVVASA
jgi:hypothetical protein